MQDIYLDTAATTKIKETVRLAMYEIYQNDYANPSSLHAPGLKTRKLVEEARESVASSLGCSKDNLIFTASGTEANNLAILGAQGRGNHFLTTKIEHPSVLEPHKELERRSFRVDYLDLDSRGYLKRDEILAALTKETRLISLGLVNNEVACIQEFASLLEAVKSVNSEVLFHCDASQAWGKLKLDVEELGLDFLTISGHKVGGPKGIGGLYVRDKQKLKPLLFGGGQEGGLRPGTENVPAIVGLGLAARTLPDEEELNTIKELKSYFYQACQKEIEDLELNGPALDEAVPHILNLSFLGVRAQVLLQALSEYGIYISSGSACSIHKKDKNHVLKALGKSDKTIESALRFSFSADLSKKDLDYVVKILKEKIKHFREIFNYG